MGSTLQMLSPKYSRILIPSALMAAMGNLYIYYPSRKGGKIEVVGLLTLKTYPFSLNQRWVYGCTVDLEKILCSSRNAILSKTLLHVIITPASGR